MVVEMLTQSITPPFYFISMPVVSSSHLLNGLSNILRLTNKAGSKVHYVSVEACVVSLDDIFSTCFADGHFCQAIFHSSTTDTPGLVMASVVTSWRNILVIVHFLPPLTSVSVSHDSAFYIGSLSGYKVNGGEYFFQVLIFMQDTYFTSDPFFKFRISWIVCND